METCKCACHDTAFNSMELHSPVVHDSKCCEKMNGSVEIPKIAQEWYDYAIDDVQKAMESSPGATFDGHDFTKFDDPNVWIPKLKKLREKRFNP